MPILCVLLIVKVLAPLNQPINLIIKFFVMHFYQVLIIKWIVIKLLQLFGHLIIDLNVGPFSILLLDQVSILGVSVELAEPSDLTEALLSLCQRLTLLWIEMEGLGFIGSIYLNLIEWG